MSCLVAIIRMYSCAITFWGSRGRWFESSPPDQNFRRSGHMCSGLLAFCPPYAHRSAHHGCEGSRFSSPRCGTRDLRSMARIIGMPPYPDHTIFAKWNGAGGSECVRGHIEYGFPKRRSPPPACAGDGLVVIFSTGYCSPVGRPPWARGLSSSSMLSLFATRADMYVRPLSDMPR